MPKGQSLEQRFLAKVDKSGPVPAHAPELGPCWVWLGLITRRGYGRVWLNGKAVYAHRASLFLRSNRWPEICCHRCDNAACVNPSHLYDGSGLDNARDAVTRGRVHRKMTPEIVQRARDLLGAGHSLANVAGAVGVSKSAIWRLRYDTNWSWLSDSGKSTVTSMPPLVADKDNRGAAPGHGLGAPKKWLRKLTDAQVMDLLRRSEGETLGSLAAEFGVARKTIQSILRGEIYQDVTGLSHNTPWCGAGPTTPPPQTVARGEGFGSAEASDAPSTPGALPPLAVVGRVRVERTGVAARRGSAGVWS